MAINDQVRALLKMSGKKNKDFALYKGMSPQAFQNKLSRGSLSAQDLIDLAAFTGCTLEFLFPDQQRILLSDTPDKKSREEAEP